MKIDYKLITQKVKKELKSRGVVDTETIEEFSQTCYDDFNLSLDEGKTEDESLEIALKSLQETLDSNNYSSKKTMPYNYSLIISSIFTIASLVVMLIGLLESNVLNIYGILYPIIFVLGLAILLTCIITYKKRNKVDFIICGLIFLSSLSVLIQCLIYFYRMRTGDFYYSLDYIFPGILQFNYHYITSTDPISYEIRNVVKLFDPCLITSIVCLIISSVLIIKEKYIKK